MIYANNFVTLSGIKSSGKSSTYLGLIKSVEKKGKLKKCYFFNIRTSTIRDMNQNMQNTIEQNNLFRVIDNFRQSHNGWIPDFSALYEVNGSLIGISTCGDDKVGIQRGIDKFNSFLDENESLKTIFIAQHPTFDEFIANISSSLSAKNNITFTTSRINEDKNNLFSVTDIRTKLDERIANTLIRYI